MEPKPFSVGFRIEHPQSLIDKAGWGRMPAIRISALPTTSWCITPPTAAPSSFCMCPGGTVVAATSEPNRVVTNGMSQYSRNERNANAGIVVNVDPADYGGSMANRWPASPSSVTWNRAPSNSAAATTTRRRSWSAISWPAGHRRPVELLGRASTLTDLADGLPAIAAMREALPAFGRQIKGFDAARRGADRRRDPHLVAVAHYAWRGFPEPQHQGLYPAGEGRATRVGFSAGLTESRSPKPSPVISQSNRRSKMTNGAPGFWPVNTQDWFGTAMPYTMEWGRKAYSKKFTGICTWVNMRKARRTFSAMPA